MNSPHADAAGRDNSLSSRRDDRTGGNQRFGKAAWQCKSVHVQERKRKYHGTQEALGISKFLRNFLNRDDLGIGGFLGVAEEFADQFDPGLLQRAEWTGGSPASDVSHGLEGHFEISGKTFSKLVLFTMFTDHGLKGMTLQNMLFIFNLFPNECVAKGSFSTTVRSTTASGALWQCLSPLLEKW